MNGADVAFWLAAVALVAGTGLVLFRAATRAQRSGQDGAANDLRIYRDQLAEVERDVTRGVLAPDEAERLRNEIRRRILDADRAQSAAGVAGAVTRGPTAALWLSGLALAAAFGIYGWLGAPGYPDLPMASRLARAAAAYDQRPSQSEAEAEAKQPLKDPADPAMAELMTRLRKAVADRPDDLRGHELLAQNEANLGNHAAAAAALAGVVRIKGADATAADYARLADAYVSAAQGYVSPEAEAAVLRTLELDAGNGVARFYLGLMHAQTLRPDLAFRIWRDLLENGPQDGPWIPAIRDRIAMLASAAGVDYTLPPEQAPPVKGPTAADVAAAGTLSGADRTQMIAGMVKGLEDRLYAEGGSAAEWAQLLTALGTLGDRNRTAAAFVRARTALAGDAAGLARAEAAAREAGILP